MLAGVALLSQSPAFTTSQTRKYELRVMGDRQHFINILLSRISHIDYTGPYDQEMFLIGRVSLLLIIPLLSAMLVSFLKLNSNLSMFSLYPVGSIPGQ